MGGADLAVIGLILVVALASGFGAWKAWRRRDWSRLVPGALVTVFGLLLLITFYRWVFDPGTCGGRGDLVCLTNENQGVLTLLALLLAGLAVWVEVLARHSEHLRRRAEEEQHANQAVAAAIEECHHNLLHAALCYTGEKMTHLPWGISIDEICALTQREYRHVVDEGVLRHIDPIRRNFESVRALRARYDNASIEEERDSAKAMLLAEPHQFSGFVVHSLGLLRDAWAAYRDVPACRELLEQPGLQDLPRLCRANAEHPAYGYFRTSHEEPQKEAATIRTEEAVIACWFDDQPIGVQTFAFGPRFIDASEAHTH
jgi:hypothetical protein